MDDYIKRKMAIDAICTDWCGTSNADCKYPFNPEKDEYYHCDGCGDVELIKALPSANVAEVVRCKDCKYWEKTSNEKGYCKDIIGFGRWWKGNDYCSYGERKDGDTDG